MEEVGSMNYTAASHQGATKIVWLHFWGTVISSIFIYKIKVRKIFPPKMTANIAMTTSMLKVYL